MYLIVDSTNKIVEVCKHPVYVHTQKNGISVLSNKQYADSIYSNDSNMFYANETHILVEFERVPPEVRAGYYYYHAGEFYTTEEDLKELVRDKAIDIASIIFVSMAENRMLGEGIIIKHPEQFINWTYPVSYAQGAICKYNSKLYRCLQAHTSQEEWAPDTAPSLWKEIGNPNAEWQEWSQPIGAIDTYSVGNKVSHKDKYWISTKDNNVWEPGVYGWEETTEEA